MPVLPTIGYWESGNVEKTGAAVPFAEPTAPISPDRIGSRTAGGSDSVRSTRGPISRSTRGTVPSPVVGSRMRLTMFGEYTVPPFAKAA